MEHSIKHADSPMPQKVENIHLSAPSPSRCVSQPIIGFSGPRQKSPRHPHRHVSSAARPLGRRSMVRHHAYIDLLGR
ncbi:hypothetical protein B0T16DRAFT_401569 [Cercophora newfieldiana]|uniref:Uncharacterized protein n=1 Tax=Cercophora newfieldiana TaxID=92897 RepID=A0AA39YRM5_9PEZI|nr:hypothetical protein B0T16DRAFT_401569 [Cercophora newfieldiana]